MPVVMPQEPDRDWHFEDGDGRHGPVHRNLLRKLWTAGEIDLETLVLGPGMDDWHPIAHMPKLQRWLDG